MRERGGIDLAIGGESWAGFKFQSYGKARDWRILTPAGDNIQAGELMALRGQLADLAFLQTFTKDQAAKLAGSTLAFTPDESHLVRVALQLILRELPVQLGRRDFQARPARLLRSV
jgi:hypothetical protein